MKAMLLFVLVLGSCVFAKVDEFISADYTIFFKSWENTKSFVSSIQNTDSFQINQVSVYDEDLKATIKCSMSYEQYQKLTAKLLSLGEVRSKFLTEPEIDSARTNVEMERSLRKVEHLDTLIRSLDVNDDTLRILYSILTDERQNLARLASVKAKNLYHYKVEAKFMQRHANEYGGSPFFSFVNMPGVEARMLILENGGMKRFAKAYAGGGLKWQYTRRSSHLDIGILKQLNPDSGAATDLLYIGLGHVVYPSFVQRRDSDFLNLFTGFNYGAIIANSNTRYSFFYLSPQIGMEWINNSKITFMTYVAYLVPLSAKYNFSSRGLELNTNFNFLF